MLIFLNGSYHFANRIIFWRNKVKPTWYCSTYVFKKSVVLSCLWLIKILAILSFYIIFFLNVQIIKYWNIYDLLFVIVRLWLQCSHYFSFNMLKLFDCDIYYNVNSTFVFFSWICILRKSLVGGASWIQILIVSFLVYKKWCSLHKWGKGILMTFLTKFLSDKNNTMCKIITLKFILYIYSRVIKRLKNA